MIRHSESSKSSNWSNAAFFLLISAFCIASVPSASAQQVKVMQWNVEGHIGNILSNNTSEAKAIARIINYNRPDVVTFCELEDNGTAATTAGVIAWVTNNLTYFGSKSGVTFWVDMSRGDGSERNGSISRYPVSDGFTYSDAGTLNGIGYFNLRGMERFRVQLSGTNSLEIFHVHLKCCSDPGPPDACLRRQSESETDATNITAWANGNSLPYIFTGDCNEDETHPECTLTSTYHPITTLIQGGGLADYKPSTLTPGIGATLTWSTASIASRLDYVLAATNRIPASAIVTGIVFRSSDWAAHGLYTNESPQNLANDSQTASDHYCVQVTYSFPTSVTNFNVTPTNTFSSSGNEGGPFSPSSQTYTLTNSDTIPLFWSVINTSNWLTISTVATNLTLAAGASTNITAFITNSVASSLLGGTYADTIVFSNTATGVAFSRGVALTINFTPPFAGFTGSPTAGTDPLAVTFADTSTGSITNRFWDFGDNNTTNVTTNAVSHVYSVGSYTVTLIASGPLGVSTNTKPLYISVVLPPSTITVTAADLQDRFASLMPTSGVAVLVADTGTNGFVDPQSTFPVTLGAAWGADDKIVGLWDLKHSFDSFWGQPGGLADQTVVDYSNGITAGQKLQLYWFPSLTLASNTLGVTYYGKYTDTNSPPLDGSASWSVPAAGSNVGLNFYTQSEGGSNPDAAGQATLLTAAGTSAFQSWQIQYFGDTNNPAAAPDADPLGKGMSNFDQFLVGLDPTNSSSTFRIRSIAPEGNSLRITWTMGPSRTNALQVSTGGVGGNYSNNFADFFTVTNTTGTVTNYLDGGATTNTPVRYYRVRLVP
jgi:PKD repeat protein